MQDILAGPPDTYHMTSKKYLTTHRGELTNRPDMDNLDAGTPLAVLRDLYGTIRSLSLMLERHVLLGPGTFRILIKLSAADL